MRHIRGIDSKNITLNISILAILSVFPFRLLFAKVESESVRSSELHLVCDMIPFQIFCCANNSLVFLIPFNFQVV